MEEHIGHNQIEIPNSTATQAISGIRFDTSKLGNFLDDAHHNVIATFTNCRPQYDTLAEIDQLYCEIIDNLNQQPEFVVWFFLFRSHSAFRGAVRLCLSGEIPESFMVLRGCLESALYGLYVTDNPKLQEIWLRRHDDEESMRQVKKEFKVSNVMNHLQSIDSKMHNITQLLYDRMIDYGAHPNLRAVLSQIRTTSSSSHADFTAEYFLCGNVQQQLSMRSAVQIGICCLDIFYNVFKTRYQILGIDERLNQIRQGF